MRFTVIPTDLPGVSVVDRRPIGDARGYLERLYCREDLSHLVGPRQIVQINRTLTGMRGTIRGLHFQHPPAAETKVVQCLRGSVFDVAVDLRASSPTFLRWIGVELSAGNHRSLLIPEGVAHGFQTLTEDCEMLYLHTAPHTPSAEGGVDALDPTLAITWPLDLSERSARDGQWDPITPDFLGLTV